MTELTQSDYRDLFMATLSDRTCVKCIHAKGSACDLGGQIVEGKMTLDEGHAEFAEVHSPENCAGEVPNPNFGGGCSELESMCGHALGAVALREKWRE